MSVMADLQPWIEQEKAKHVRRIVNMAKRGFERIEKVWDENEPCSPKEESLAAATLDKHDAIIRRNLEMSETSTGSCSLNLPLAEVGSNYRVNPKKDLRPVWPNCHAVIHRRKPPLSVAEVRRLIRKV